MYYCAYKALRQTKYMTLMRLVLCLLSNSTETGIEVLITTMSYLRLKNAATGLGIPEKTYEGAPLSPRKQVCPC